MASNLRVDTILPSSGTTLGIGTASGTINFLGDSNLTTTGSISAASATITGNLGVGGVLTYEDVTNIDSVGVITARDGLRVTGIATATGLDINGNADVSGNMSVGGAIQIQDATTAFNKHSVGIGTTTTAGRNAGVSTATGTIIYNTTLNQLQIYVGNEWKKIKIDLGPLTLSYLVIGGGGAGGGDFRSGGGGAGAYRTNWNNENQGGGQSSGAPKTLTTGTAYSVVVGPGGTGVDDAAGNNGQQSKFDDITANGGGGGGGYGGNGQASSGSSGGSSGGGGGYDNNGQAPGASGTYGYSGGTGSSQNAGQTGGGGGGAGGTGYCLLYTSPSPRDGLLSRMPSSA